MKLAGIVSWSILVVLIDVAFARVAFGALVPSLRSGLGLDLAAVGAVASANSIGYLLTSAFAAQLERLVGVRRLAIGSHLLAAAAFAGVAFAPGFVPLIVMRFLSGAGGGGGVVAAQRIALDAVPPERRVLVSTITWSGVGLGLIAAGVALPALSSPQSWRAASLVCAIIALVVALTTPAPAAVARASAASEPPAWRWQNEARVLAAYALFGMGFLAYNTFAAVSSLHASPGARFLLLGFAAIVGTLLAMRVRQAELGMGAGLILGAAGAMLTLAHMQLAGDLLIGLGFGPVPGFATAILRQRAGTAAAMSAIALSTIAVGAGQIAGPIVAGMAAQNLGIAWVAGIAAVAYFLGFLLIVADALARIHLKVPASPARDFSARATSSS